MADAAGVLACIGVALIIVVGVGFWIRSYVHSIFKDG